MVCFLALLWGVLWILIIAAVVSIAIKFFELPMPSEKLTRAILGVLGMIFIIYLVGCLLAVLPAPPLAPWKH